MKLSFFVVDDDKHYSRLLSYRLGKNSNHKVKVFHSGEDALNNLDENPDVIILDIMMPGISGVDTLQRIKERKPNIPVIMVSAQGVVDVAVKAIQLGAKDYITKGEDDLVKLDIVVRNVTESVKLQREVENLRDAVSDRYKIKGLIGESKAIKEVYRLVDKTLRGDLTVAIQGESGTGKELVSRAIHYGSGRGKGPFVVVNCAAIPSELMESEFFGHEKGSFTGAHQRKIGKFEQADGGTIFLDEIGELDLSLQAKLLRALQNREIVRVGGNEVINFDARVISATNQNVLEMIKAGTFREDLYYRLFQFPVQLPPLRERGQDGLILAAHFLREYKKDYPEFEAKTLSPMVRKKVLDFSWPGNVRELKNVIERAILISDTDEIQVADLMLDLQTSISPWQERSNGSNGNVAMSSAGGNGMTADNTNGEMQPTAGVNGIGSDSKPSSSGILPLEEMKRRAVEQAFHLCDNNVDKAAVELAIGRATMYRLLKKYDLM